MNDVAAAQASNVDGVMDDAICACERTGARDSCDRVVSACVAIVAAVAVLFVSVTAFANIAADTYTPQPMIEAATPALAGLGASLGSFASQSVFWMGAIAMLFMLLGVVEVSIAANHLVAWSGNSTALAIGTIDGYRSVTSNPNADATTTAVSAQIGLYVFLAVACSTFFAAHLYVFLMSAPWLVTGNRKTCYVPVYLKDGDAEMVSDDYVLDATLMKENANSSGAQDDARRHTLEERVARWWEKKMSNAGGAYVPRWLHPSTAHVVTREHEMAYDLSMCYPQGAMSLATSFLAHVVLVLVLVTTIYSIRFAFDTRAAIYSGCGGMLSTAAFAAAFRAIDFKSLGKHALHCRGSPVLYGISLLVAYWGVATSSAALFEYFEQFGAVSCALSEPCVVAACQGGSFASASAHFSIPGSLSCATVARTTVTTNAVMLTTLVVYYAFTVAQTMHVLRMIAEYDVYGVAYDAMLRKEIEVYMRRTATL